MEQDASIDEQLLRRPFGYTFEQFKEDIRWVFYLQAEMIAAMRDAGTAMRFLGKERTADFADFDPERVPDDFTYDDIRHTPFALSLEAMYRYAYHGEVDNTIEPLGPGGFHIVMAAIIRDLANSSLVKFWMHIGGQGRESVSNCLRTAELANARLILEGEERFFNFDSGGEYESLAMVDRVEPPHGGYGKALTIRQMALLADMGEPTIRTAANPKRAHHIPTYSHDGRTVIAIQDAKDWLQKKGRYISIKPRQDIRVLELAERRFTDIKDLLGTFVTRVVALDNGSAENPEHLTAFQRLCQQYGFTAENITPLSDPTFVAELAELLSFPPRLFALRVEEVLLAERLKALRQEVKETVQHSLT
ncbi:hypothetical protein [Noviherbaspirillum sp. UKPF54]|uniref:hypothetical protein n=1 Tax=Noviherbaspirillum sp. UKPF54 TaxID=2601898 RepID=UPI0011B1174C|nr:hypothetical protein [Noviherbaspirillum sp. UKPF54]QDZ29561.1 hypothetical protein FAY22_17295 [Noviherbaspirillum sp. UKPF54]